jgi:hypothetical protein
MLDVGIEVMTDLLAVVTTGSDFKVLRRGLGSEGLDILCFRPEPVLDLGSEAIEGEEAVELLLNHLEGFDKKLPSPGDGERTGERGAPLYALIASVGPR